MSLQETIIKELKVKPEINVIEEIEKRKTFIKDYLKQHKFIESLVLGISGGQDSTLCGKLCQLAINELKIETGNDNYKFIAVRLPYGKQFDEDDCNDALEFIKPDYIYTVNIKDSVDASFNSLKESGIIISDFAKGNEKARERMKVQYSIATMNKGLVIGTDHAAEAITGFYTKYGDGGVDIVPLFGLNKRQGKKLLKHLNCPEHLYNKKPTADLEEDKPALPDEEALGITYNEIDDYLEGKEISTKSKDKLEAYYIRSIHKRSMPVTLFDFYKE